MKLSCSQEDLSKGLRAAGRAAAASTTLPITRNILLTAEKSRLKLTATNMEVAITYWIGAKVEKEGSIAVPARLLIDFISSLPSDSVEIKLPAKRKILELKSGRFEAQINGIDATEFPSIPEVSGDTATIGANELREGIEYVAFAAAREDSRPVLTGVNCEFEGDQLNLAAADGFRLAVHKTKLSAPVKQKTTVIIPARTLNELSRLLVEQEEAVEITVDKQKGQICFHLKEAQIVSQLIQGSFPDFTQVIPQSYTTRAVVDINDFLRIGRISSIFNYILRLTITPGNEHTPGKITVLADEEATGMNISEVDALVDGEESEIAFNASYLVDVLDVLVRHSQSTQVAMEITTSSRPCAIRPVGLDNYTHMIMPMFVGITNRR